MSNAPDIEIYLEKVKYEQVLPWLENVFDELTLLKKKKGMPKNAQPVSLLWQGSKIFSVVFENVVPGYTSVWMDSRELPWENDQQCAEKAAEFFNCKVRFVTDSWQQQQDPDAWIQIDENGELSEITWKTE